ncbi:MAG: dihydroxyacetone kinase subunit DhaL [Aggregatilineales bacterium]
MNAVSATHGRRVLNQLAEVIHINAAYLSQLDGAVGDGDHGINMDKGFSKARERTGENASLSEALRTLGNTLLGEIGGAMGPLYGTFFLEMAAVCANKDTIDTATFRAMLEAALAAIQDLGNAKVGDKTLLDTLVPAVEAYRGAHESGASFAECLAHMRSAAERGRESTRDLVAKIGRASRLGERSRGHLDAGATSCFLILSAFSEAFNQLLQES